MYTVQATIYIFSQYSKIQLSPLATMQISVAYCCFHDIQVKCYQGESEDKNPSGFSHL